MVETKIISLLEDTLRSVRETADNKSGWQTIIGMYETAIACAKNNHYFSVQDPVRIYLEFSNCWKTDIFEQLQKTSAETRDYFYTIFHSYVKAHVIPSKVDDRIKELSRFDDIYTELNNFILAGEQFSENCPLVAVKGYTAKRLADETILTPLGAYLYLVYLREQPEDALADLKKLSRKEFVGVTDWNSFKVGLEKGYNGGFERGYKECYDLSLKALVASLDKAFVWFGKMCKIIRSNRIFSHVSNDEIGDVLDKNHEQARYDAAFEKGYRESLDRALKALVNTLDRIGLSFEEICSDVRKNKVFSDVTDEEIREYLNGDERG